MKSYKTKKRINGFLSLFISLVMIISSVVVFPLTALAVDDPGTLDSSTVEFWADPENTLTADDIEAYKNGDKTTMVGAVAVHKRSGSSSNYYLFLPSTADCTNLKIWYTGTAATVDGEAVASGEATDAFSDINAGGLRKKYTIAIDGTSYSVSVIKSGDVGTVYIDTESGSIASINNSEDKSAYESGTIMVVEPNGKVDFDGGLDKMKGRGNATWNAKGTKNPYNIKIAKKTELLGMAKSKKWCLLANADDATLIKNQMTYDFSKYVGVKCQVVCKPVDLYVNQQYLGSYQLAEKVEIGSNRVEVTDSYENLEKANERIDEVTGDKISDLDGTEIKEYSDENGTEAQADTWSNVDKNAQKIGTRKYSPSLVSPSDVTGGYLYELEISNRWEGDGAGFCAYNRQGWVVKNCDYASKDMVNYSYDLMYALGSSVYNGGVVPSSQTTTNCSGLNYASTLVYGPRSVTNPAPKEQYQGKKWDELLDADSAVRYYWTQEYFKNMDSSTSSTYFFKDSDSIDSMLYAGPVWDMDLSVRYNSSGSRWGYSFTSPTGWYTKETRIYRWRANDSDTDYSDDQHSPRSFYGALANNCPGFWTTAQNYWYSKIEPATQILLGNATDESGVLKSVDEYVNTVKKSGTMNKLRHNLDSDEEYDNVNIKNDVKNWLSQRTEWISGQISKVVITTDSKYTIERVAEQNYTGREIKPELTVKYDGVLLKEGEDYTAEYSNNVLPTNYATILVKGKGLYTGEEAVYFTIKRGTLAGGSAVISETANPEDVLSIQVCNAQGEELNTSIKYQWQRDGENIEGETSDSYTVQAEDIGKTITVTVTGDGEAMEATSVTSNACAVEKKVNSNVIASWNYDYTKDSAALANADETGESFCYTANGGEQKDAAKLTGSVTAQSVSEIKWSGEGENYANTSNTVESDQTPIIGTDKTAGIAWGEYPYFETVFSTTGYENIKFSAKLAGTKKAPRDYKVQYSLNGTDFTDIEGATYSLTTSKVMEQAFDKLVLPSACDNQANVYVRVTVCNDIAVNGTNTIVNQTSGDASINNIVITGEVGEAPQVTNYKVKFVNFAGETVSETEYAENTPKESIVKPANTAAGFDANNHYTYLWGDFSDVTADATYTETRDAQAHTFKKTSSTPATCTENGEEKYECTCGYAYTSTLSATGHKPGAAVKEKVTTKSYDEVVYCTVCKKELSRKTVAIPATVPSGTAPSAKEADAAKENKSIVKINSSKITTAVHIQKKTLKVNFKTNKNATNYRIRYRKAGAKKWTYAWTGGKGTYTIKNLKKNGLYQFQIAVYVYKNGVWQRSKYSNVNYRYFFKLAGVKAAAGKKQATVTWTPDKKAAGYDISYSTSKNGKRTLKTVKGAKNKKYTIKKLKKGKKYYIMVRSYKMKGGKKYTGQWTTKVVKIK